jgi:hypothetical protein
MKPLLVVFAPWSWRRGPLGTTAPLSRGDARDARKLVFLPNDGLQMEHIMGRCRVAAVAILIALFGARSWPVQLLPAAAAPRVVEPRGGLSEAERATIAMFEAIAPSVVQVVVRSASINPFAEEEGRVSSGTGFIWDEAGHVVTNDHVVQSAGAVRCGSPLARWFKRRSWVWRRITIWRS